jgi:hypothetical protein
MKWGKSYERKKWWWGKLSKARESNEIERKEVGHYHQTKYIPIYGKTH